MANYTVLAMLSLRFSTYKLDILIPQLRYELHNIPARFRLHVAHRGLQPLPHERSFNSSHRRISAPVIRACRSYADRFPKVFHQFLCDIRVFQPHDAFLRISVAEKIDAAVPDDLLVYDSKFLMDVGFKQKAHAGIF